MNHPLAPQIAAAPGPMVDILSPDGLILGADPVQAAQLGLTADALEGADWARIYTLDARDRIAALFAQGTAAITPAVLPMVLRMATGATLATAAVADWVDEPQHGRCLRLWKWPTGGALDDVARLSEANEVLSGIVAASSDAGWCMEWADPVDLSAPEHEIVRQVFENGPRWRFCNEAMARLYRTPPGKDFNALPVSETFPRTPENEDFIRRLIRADFDMTASPSRDLRYDGMFIDVENDVRGHIRGNKLVRMWGTVRDVSKHVRRETLLRDEIGALQSVLAALPDPVLVVDDAGAPIYLNIAAEALFEGPPEVIALRQFEDLLETGRPLAALLADATSLHATRSPFSALALRPSGPLRVDGTAASFDLRGTPALVLCLRPASRAERGAQ